MMFLVSDKSMDAFGTYKEICESCKKVNILFLDIGTSVVSFSHIYNIQLFVSDHDNTITRCKIIKSIFTQRTSTLYDLCWVIKRLKKKNHPLGYKTEVTFFFLIR